MVAQSLLAAGRFRNRAATRAADGLDQKPEEWQSGLVFLGLAEAVVGLILVEQLFRTVSEDSRWNIKPLCLAPLFQFGFDLYLFADALMFNHVDGDALYRAGFVHAATVPLLMLSTERSGTGKPYFGVTLFASGIYLLFMASVELLRSLFRWRMGRALQFALVVAAMLGLGILLVSGSIRAKLRFSSASIFSITATTTAKNGCASRKR